MRSTAARTVAACLLLALAPACRTPKVDRITSVKGLCESSGRDTARPHRLAKGDAIPADRSGRCTLTTGVTGELGFELADGSEATLLPQTTATVKRSRPASSQGYRLGVARGRANLRIRGAKSAQ